MALETFEIEHLPATRRVHAAFFRDVSNSDFLHAQLIGRNPDFDYAFIDASSVISRNQLLSAIFRALTDQLNGAQLTATTHSEVVLSLSPSNNVRHLPPILACLLLILVAHADHRCLS